MLALLNLQVLMKSYIPSELVAEKKGELFDALITLLQANVSKDPIVDQLFDFLATKDNISTAIEWLINSQITIEGEAIYFVRTRQKHQILKALFKSADFDTELKMELLESVLGKERSEQAETCRAHCIASLPDPTVKARVW